MKSSILTKLLLMMMMALILQGCGGTSANKSDATVVDANTNNDEEVNKELYSMGTNQESPLEGKEEETPTPIGGDENLTSNTDNAEIQNEIITEVPRKEAQVENSPSGDLDTADLSVYRVQDNRETLMLISFKIYGDYTRWKELALLNRDMFDDRYIVKKGMMLKFRMPDSPFEWEKNGDPYLVTRGDTLTKISEKVYHTFRRWKKIFENNRPLIRDPNRIFAGFTIYTPDLAQETRPAKKKNTNKSQGVEQAKQDQSTNQETTAL